MNTKTFVLTAILGATGFSGCSTLENSPAREADEKKHLESEFLQSEKQIIINQLSKGQPRKSLKTLKALLARFPRDSELLTLMGLTQLSLKNPSSALSYFKKSYRIKPDIKTGLNLSSAHLEAKEWRQARQVLFDLLKTKQAESYLFHERIYHNIALSFESEHNLQQAKIYYQKALQENPGYYLSLIQLAHLAAKLGNLKESVGLYTKAMRSCTTCFEPIEALVQRDLRKKSFQSAYNKVKSYMMQDGLLPEDRGKAQQLMDYAYRQAEKQKNLSYETQKQGRQ